MSLTYTLMNRLLGLLGVLLFAQACAISGPLQVARDQFRHGSTSEALQTLSEADVSRRDQLLLYLDKGLVAQAAGRYEDSIVAFDQATNLVDELDYISLRDQSAAMLTNDWATRYSGELSERLWIHTFQMVNYLMLGFAEGAAVEARRASALMEEHSDILNRDQFTRALMVLSFQSAGQYDSAQVEYRKLAEDFDLPIDAPLPKRWNSNDSELVLFVASGFIDPKLPGDLFLDVDARISFPYYADSYQEAPTISVHLAEQAVDFSRADTALLNVSKKALSERGKIVAARQALRLTAKYGISKSIKEQDELAGKIAQVLLAQMEQADTRSWETLPRNLSLLRIPLTPGQHSLSLRVSGYGGGSDYNELNRDFDISIAAGERQFKLVRVGVNPE